MTGKVIIAGGSGFLGRALARRWSEAGAEVVILSRQPAPAAGRIRTVAWDGRTVGAWVAELEGAAVVVNLAGRSVACIHNAKNRRLILSSRVDSVRAIDTGLGTCARPPRVWLQATSLAIYGNPGDQICDETAPFGEGFSADVCKAWEGALFSRLGPASPTRRVALRIGIVLGPDGGGLGPLAALARWYLGGQAGNGRQYISWVHLGDFCALCEHLAERSTASGVFNACAPAPATNAEFMREVRQALGRPWSPPAPAWAVRLGARFILRVDADLALTGRRCLPRRLVADGFLFHYPELRPALQEILRPAQKNV